MRENEWKKLLDEINEEKEPTTKQALDWCSRAQTGAQELKSARTNPKSAEDGQQIEELMKPDGLVDQTLILLASIAQKNEEKKPCPILDKRTGYIKEQMTQLIDEINNKPPTAELLEIWYKRYQIGLNDIDALSSDFQKQITQNAVSSEQTSELRKLTGLLAKAQY